MHVSEGTQKNQRFHSPTCPGHGNVPSVAEHDRLRVPNNAQVLHELELPSSAHVLGSCKWTRIPEVYRLLKSARYRMEIVV